MKNLLFATFILLTAIACDKKEEVDPNLESPTILSLVTDKTDIKTGELAEIRCEATGGELVYEWNAMLGDIIPQNEDASIVNFSGFECCYGERIIMCRVKNSMGEAIRGVGCGRSWRRSGSGRATCWAV